MTTPGRSSVKPLTGLPLPVEIYLGAVPALFTAIYFFVPAQHDDLWYMEPFFPYLRGEAPFSLSDGLETLLWHYEHDNARLANMSTPLTLVLLPRWIFNLLSGVMVWVMLRFAVLMTGYPGNRRIPASAGVLLISTLVLLLPWYNFILTPDFTLNYVWTGAGVTFFLYMIMRPEVFRSAAWPWKVCICIVVLLAGAMHEGASAIACIGAALIILTDAKEKRLTAVRMLLFGLFAVGTACVCLAPAILNKLADGTTSSPGVSLMAALRASLLLIIFCAVTAVTVSVRKFRKRIGRQRLITAGIFLIMALCMEWLLLFSGLGGDRIMWFGDLAAGIGTFTLLTPLRGNRTWRAAAILSVLFTLANLSSTLYYQVGLMKEYRQVTELMRKPGTKTIVVTPATGADFLPIDLGKPIKTQLNIRYNLLNELYSPGKRVALIPHRVARTPIAGMNRVGEHFLTAGPFIVAYDTVYGPEQYETFIHIRYTGGTAMTIPGTIHPFTREGRRYYYIDAPRPRTFYSRRIESVK